MCRGGLTLRLLRGDESQTGNLREISLVDGWIHPEIKVKGSLAVEPHGFHSKSSAFAMLCIQPGRIPGGSRVAFSPKRAELCSGGSHEVWECLPWTRAKSEPGTTQTHQHGHQENHPKGTCPCKSQISHLTQGLSPA